MSKMNDIHADVGSMIIGEVRNLSLINIDAVTYRAYLGKYCVSRVKKFKTTYDRNTNILSIRRVS